jgi:hypothetical protein
VVPVAVIDKFLFPVLAGINRGLQVPDCWRLQGRAERAERGIDIIRFLFYRAVIGTIANLNTVASGKPESHRVAWFMTDDHAETGE